MKTVDQLMDWCAGALEQFGDPCEPVCQMFFRWQTPGTWQRSSELSCGVVDGKPTLWLGPIGALPLEISSDGHTLHADGTLASFGAEQISAGVWALFPSLNVRDLVHGFVVLYGVPDPAPWERLIVVPA